jgi:hypothetical protein
MLIATLALLLSEPGPGDELPRATMADALAQRQAIATQCRISLEQLEIEHSEESPVFVVVVKGPGPFSDRQFDCISRNSTGGVQFSIEDGRQGNRYDAWRERTTLANARADLRRRGLLRKLPKFDAQRETLAEFAARLERLCGAAPGSSLKAEDNWLVRSGETSGSEVGASPDAFDRDAFDRESCAISAATLAGFDPFGRPAEPIRIP